MGNNPGRREVLIGGASAAAIAASTVILRNRMKISKESDNLAHLRFPIADIAIKRVKEYSRKLQSGELGKRKNLREHIRPADMKIVHDIFYSLIREDIERTSLFESKESGGVSFPMTVMNTADIAIALYKRYSGQEPELKEVETDSDKKKEFVFPSFPTSANGAGFSHYEAAFNQIILRLPEALEKIRKGEKPESVDVYIIGSPTNYLGTITDKFASDVKKRGAFNAFGDLYAECVTKELQREKTSNATFFGFSMGASFATKTAERLLKDGAVTQAPRTEGTRLQVAAYTPVGAMEDGNRRIGIGFLVESIRNINEYAIVAFLTEGKFNKDVNKILLDTKGLRENMSPKQKEFKKFTLDSIIDGLKKGVPIAPSLKVDMIRGTKDPLAPSEEFKEKAREHMFHHMDSLGMYEVPEEDPKRKNQRTTAVNMSHTIPFFSRASEAERIIRTANALENLKTDSH